MQGLLPSIIPLGIVALAAALIAWNRPSPAANTAQRHAAARALTIAVAIQVLHFGEETAGAFHERFPALFGLPPMPLSLFLIFNIAWIGFWIASVPRIRSNRRLAFFAAWFLGIAGILNGIAHPLMALYSGGYFPGLVTSPFIAVAAYFLCRRLRFASRAESSGVGL